MVDADRLDEASVADLVAAVAALDDVSAREFVAAIEDGVPLGVLAEAALAHADRGATPPAVESIDEATTGAPAIVGQTADSGAHGQHSGGAALVPDDGTDADEVGIEEFEGTVAYLDGEEDGMISNVTDVLGKHAGPDATVTDAVESAEFADHTIPEGIVAAVRRLAEDPDDEQAHDLLKLLNGVSYYGRAVDGYDLEIGTFRPPDEVDAARAPAEADESRPGRETAEEAAREDRDGDEVVDAAPEPEPDRPAADGVEADTEPSAADADPDGAADLPTRAGGTDGAARPAVDTAPGEVELDEYVRALGAAFVEGLDPDHVGARAPGLPGVDEIATGDADALTAELARAFDASDGEPTVEGDTVVVDPASTLDEYTIGEAIAELSETATRAVAQQRLMGTLGDRGTGGDDGLAGTGRGDGTGTGGGPRGGRRHQPGDAAPGGPPGPGGR